MLQGKRPRIVHHAFSFLIANCTVSIEHWRFPDKKTGVAFSQYLSFQVLNSYELKDITNLVLPQSCGIEFFNDIPFPVSAISKQLNTYLSGVFILEEIEKHVTFCQEIHRLSFRRTNW
jgi:hypothetical protein